MKIFPAIDLYGGQVVRLFQGDFNNKTTYETDPLRALASLEEQGATHMHIIDLDGARTGKTTNLALIERMVKESGCFIQVGGGIRDMATIERYLSAGVSRAILGTAAVKNPDFAAEACARFGEQIAVGVDLYRGRVAVSGWTEVSEHHGDDFCHMMQEAGVSTVLCTDISKDGSMGGSNVELYQHMTKEFSMNIIASGGISTLEELKKLKQAGLYAAVVGKAIYEGVIDLSAAVRLEAEE